MLIGTVEHNAKAALLSLVEDINSQDAIAWGVVAIKRACLNDLTNEDLVLAIKPALQEVAKAKIFFMEDGTIYVTWFGLPRQTHQRLMTICQSLMRPGLRESVDNIVTYFDPQTMGEELQILLNNQAKKWNRAEDGRNAFSSMPAAEDWSYIEFQATPAQADQFRRFVGARPARQRLNILIVEDQSFLRNLLSEVLRNDFEISAASNLKEGWASFLERAPDIIFLDIQLPDGSGHALAHAIKELDPFCYIAMVTASNLRNDVELAKQNHVDGFVIKPFNKKKISDCIDHYRTMRATPSKKRDTV